MISETLKEFLNEIRAEDAYRDEDAIQSVISGKRELAFLAMSTQKLIDPRPSIEALNVAINRGLNILPVRGRDEGVAFIVYRRNAKMAQELADLASSKGGYLNDQTPEEAEKIGKLLSYDQADIEKYIERRYGK